jgi:phospholipid/cholesterol/gamma-HCH transport system substrate-binding protein
VDERVMQFRVGLMVFGTLLVTAILAVLFGKIPSLHGTYTVHILFPEAPGVSVDTAVRKSGIRIGRVSDVDFTEDDQVLVTVDIDKNRRLRHNEVCRVGTTLLGDSTLQFAFDPKNKDTSEIKDRETVKGYVQSEPVAVLTDLQGQLSVAIRSVTKTSDEIGMTAGEIRDFIGGNKGQVNRLMDQSDKTLQAIQKVLDSTNDFVSDPQLHDSIRETIMRMPQMMKDAHETVLRLRTTMDLVEKNLRNVEDFTKPLGEHGESVFNRLDQSSQKLDRVMSDMLQFTQALNNQQGTLGQLVNNPELYQHLNRAAKNIDELSRQLKPIVDDARVITDKVARHPGVVISDAVRPGLGIK